MLTLLATVAHAQSFTILDDAVVDATQVPGGAGAPSVLYNPGTGAYTMFFETQLTPPAGCTEAYGLRKAHSTDGETFVVHPTWRLGPQPLFPCGARHPSALRHDDGTRAVFFQALDTEASDAVGVVTNVNGSAEIRILGELDGFHEPTVTRVAGIWTILGILPGRGVGLARSSDLSTFTVDAQPAIEDDDLVMTADGFAMPALGCTEDPMYPYHLYFGGWSGAEKAWSWAAGDATGHWFVAPALGSWRDDTAWSGIDYVTDGTSTLVFFETTDTGGLPRVGVARSGGALNAALIVDRDCQ